MALNNFIPEVWAAQLLTTLERAHVFAAPGVANRDYEGEIAEAGDTVRINSIGDPTISDYTKNTNLSDPETLTDAQRTLLINQAKSFNFQVDDIDKAQGKGDVMPEAMRRAAFGLRDVVDRYIAALEADVAAANVVNSGTPVVPNTTAGTTAYDYLVDLAVKLDEADNPEEGRWVVVPPWFHGRLLKDDRFVKSGTDSAAQALANGVVGEAAGFSVRKSNNVVNTSSANYRILAGAGTLGISFAEQVNKVEGYRPEKRFGDAVKGLHLWGAKVVRPTALAVLPVSPS